MPPIKHSTIGASSAYIWMTCPGSVKLSEKTPKEPPSEYAEEGTRAHALAELCLKKRISPSKTVGRTIKEGGKSFTVSEEMAQHVSLYWEYIMGLTADLMAGDDVKLEVEKRVDLSWLHEGLFGTCDAVVVVARTLFVVDLKYGEGVAVYPEKNPQLMYYALGALQEVHDAGDEIDTVHTVIVQPRTEDPFRTWTISARQLWQWGTCVLKPAAQATEELSHIFRAGKHCRWCKAAAICPTLAKHNTELAKLELTSSGSLALPEPGRMAPADIGKLLNAADMISSWVSSVKKYAQSQAEAGTNIPGCKLVKKRANRKWVDGAEASLQQVLGEEAFQKKVLSPAQIEKIFKAKGLDKDSLFDLYYTPDAGLALVPESDRRKAVPPPLTALEDFNSEMKGN